MDKLISSVFSIRSESDFEHLALQVFAFQYQNNNLYRQFCEGLRRNPSNVSSHWQIPFLPIQFFKTHDIVCAQPPFDLQFLSSGTTELSMRSKHWVKNRMVYETSFLKTFELFFGSPQQYTLLALLPNYMEQGSSSLVYMINRLIELSNKEHSGFLLNDFEDVNRRLLLPGKKILVGVSYALLDFLEFTKGNIVYQDLMLMETGGMKGRRKEMVKEELHEVLKNGFGLSQIYSEYGMTELLSQAYSVGKGIYECPPWMKTLMRDVYNPLEMVPENKTGAINVIDLANIYSCSFIATDDLGRKKANDSFEVLGRINQAEVRGCNLMIE